MLGKKDRNFDHLIQRFGRKIYGTEKGEWRLKLLKEDLAEFHDSPNKLTVWDAGCGFGQVGLWLAESGHSLILSDISKKMLAIAKKNYASAGIDASFHHLSVQVLAPQLPQSDLVLFHAVLEWMADPLSSLKFVTDNVRPGGYLSLLFYNRNAMVYTNVLKGGWRWRNILDDSYLGKGKKLTPPNPQFPHVVIEHLSECGFQIKTQTGIRVFQDYMSPAVQNNGNQSELLELEYRYCRLPTYKDMGRYVHILACKNK